MGTLRRPALSVELAIADSDGWTLNGGNLSKLTYGNLLEGPISQWEDLRCETVSANWRRGSVSPLDFYEVTAGIASVRVWDPDRNLDPANSLSPFFARLRAGIPFRLSWTNSETPAPNPADRSPLFTGYLWALSWESEYANLTGVDELTRLAQVNLDASAAVGFGDGGIQRIQRIMNAANSSATLRRRNSNPGRSMDSTTLDGNALDQIRFAARSEWGLLTVLPDGTLSYGAEFWSSTVNSSLGNLNDNPEVFTEATSPGLSWASVRNVVTVTSTNPYLTPVTASDQTSVDLYGLNQWGLETSLLYQADLTWWAGVGLNLYKANPAGWPQVIGINGSYDNGSNPNTDIYQLLNNGNADTIGLAWTVSIQDISAKVQICGRTDNYTPETGWETLFTTFANPYTYTTNYFTLELEPRDRLDYSAVLK
jgi:hypothetical protein